MEKRQGGEWERRGGEAESKRNPARLARLLGLPFDLNRRPAIKWFDIDATLCGSLRSGQVKAPRELKILAGDKQGNSESKRKDRLVNWFPDLEISLNDKSRESGEREIARG